MDQPDVDMFMGNWKDSKIRMEFGKLEVRDILTRCTGDPLSPGKKGAVLTDINAVSYAVLKPHASTKPSVLKSEQHIYYIVSGKGTIKAGAQTADLFEGIGIIMPPGIEFTISNPGDELLAMYRITEPIPSGFRPRTTMVVRSEYDNTISTNLRRGSSNDWLFEREDGLSTLVALNPVMYEPRSMVPPHVHPDDVEEVWIAVKGDLFLQVGSQRRNFPAGTAYKVPADSRTPHANINTDEVSKKLLWMMKVPVVTVPGGRKEDDLKGII
ncbi:cupin domain-containing protein [bacterium]|nr:cupin domain-containing protein [bacterium]